MLTNEMPAATLNDADLVAASLAGEREAFGEIVARYQGLVCSLTFSATGNVAQSEDLAQETFVTAWKRLADLREPEKLRPWLCGIARNLINNSLRKQQREPSHAAEPIEAASGNLSPEPLPVERTMSNEEQAILWRSLEKIPETYREPLVLFYREHQSVEAVAEKLDLSAETVHQRLSRGRKLLAEEVTAFVEGALARTNPGQMFTAGVLLALPGMTLSAKAATLGAAAKGGAAVNGSLLGLLLGPAIAFGVGIWGWRESLKQTRTPRERALVVRSSLIMVAGSVGFVAALLAYSGLMVPQWWSTHPGLVVGTGALLMLAWGSFVLGYARRMNRVRAALREEERRLHPELFQEEPAGFALDYRSRATFLGLPLVHIRGAACGAMWRPGEKVTPAIGWIAIGEVAYGVIYASGGIAVGGICVGGVSVGLFAFGGVSVGLLALGGLALGAVAMGGGSAGWVASGGFALAWHAALGGVAAAHDLACGGVALANHFNDDLARGFFQRYWWLDITRTGPRTWFWGLCFGPIALQLLVWKWWRCLRTAKIEPPRH